MILEQQRGDFSAGNQFSFASPIPGAGDGQNRMDPTKHAAKIEKEDDFQLEAWTRRASLNYDYPKHNNKVEEDDSRIPSPSLWENTEHLRTRSADSSPMHKHPSRAEEISRYRQEMLDLVRDMPESTYELSLRDMVEAPRIAKTVQETIEKRREKVKSNAGGKVKSKGMRKLSRKESVETGLFLKMFVPIPLGGGRRKSSERSNSCAKVSPKPVVTEAEKGGMENMELEWGKTNELSGSGSGSTSSSSSRSKGSSKSTSRSNSRKPVGCYAFLLSNKSRSRET